MVRNGSLAFILGRCIGFLVGGPRSLSFAEVSLIITSLDGNFWGWWSATSNLWTFLKYSDWRICTDLSALCLCVHAWARVCVCVRARVCVCAHVRVQACMCVCVCSCVHMCVGSGKTLVYYFITTHLVLRQWLLLNLKLGWWSTSLNGPPVSTSAQTCGAADMCAAMPRFLMCMLGIWSWVLLLHRKCSYLLSHPSISLHLTHIFSSCSVFGNSHSMSFLISSVLIGQSW